GRPTADTSGDGALQLADVVREIAFALRHAAVPLGKLLFELVELLGPQLELGAETRLANAALVGALLQLRRAPRDLELALLGLIDSQLELFAQRGEILLTARDELLALVRAARVGLARGNGPDELGLTQLKRVLAALQLCHQRKRLLGRAPLAGALTFRAL